MGRPRTAGGQGLKSVRAIERERGHFNRTLVRQRQADVDLDLVWCGDKPLQWQASLPPGIQTDGNDYPFASAHLLSIR